MHIISPLGFELCQIQDFQLSHLQLVVLMQLLELVLELLTLVQAPVQALA